MDTYKFSKLQEFQLVTKARGKETVERRQFDRSADGLLEAITIFGPIRLTGFINQALEREAREELQPSGIPFRKEEQK